MIRKLDTKMEYVEISVLGNKKAECLDFEAGKKLNLKINELVDVVNAIQKEREAERFEIQEWIGILEAVRESVNIHEKQIDELQMKLRPIIEERESQIKVYEETMEMVKQNDPYAEQRKWIGKLCRCWDSDINDDIWGILQDIKDNKTEKYYLYGIGYEHCEPVKPNDDIIYQKD